MEQQYCTVGGMMYANSYKKPDIESIKAKLSTSVSPANQDEVKAELIRRGIIKPDRKEKAEASVSPAPSKITVEVKYPPEPSVNPLIEEIAKSLGKKKSWTFDMIYSDNGDISKITAKEI